MGGRSLLISGVDEEGIRTMVRDNPATLLGLPPIAEQSENRRSLGASEIASDII